jgi:hypothetical protein
MPGDNKTIEGPTRKNSFFPPAAAENNREALLPVFGSVAKAGVQAGVPLPTGEIPNEIQLLHRLSDRIPQSIFNTHDRNLA